MIKNGHVGFVIADCGECLTMYFLPVFYMPIAALRAGEPPVVFFCGCAHSLRTKVRVARNVARH